MVILTSEGKQWGWQDECADQVRTNTNWKPRKRDWNPNQSFFPPVFVGGDVWEDVTAGWPASWTWAIRGSSPLPYPWNVRSACCSHSQSYFQGCNLERAICCPGHLDSVGDWTQSRPPYKLFRFWKASVGIDLFCLRPR